MQLIRQASNVGHLYGSVSARDIVEALEAEGAEVTKSQIVLDRPIKAIGMHDVKVALHPEVAVTVKVNVARSPEEADLQAQGIDVMAQMFERDAAPPPEELVPDLVAETEETAEVEQATAEPETGDAEAETGDAEAAEKDEAAGTATKEATTEEDKPEEDKPEA